VGREFIEKAQTAVGPTATGMLSGKDRKWLDEVLHTPRRQSVAMVRTLIRQKHVSNFSVRRREEHGSMISAATSDVGVLHASGGK